MTNIVVFLIAIFLIGIAPGIAAFFALRAIRDRRAATTVWLLSLIGSMYWSWCAYLAYPKHQGRGGPGGPGGDWEFLIWMVLYAPAMGILIATFLQVPRPFRVGRREIAIGTALGLALFWSTFVSTNSEGRAKLSARDLTEMAANPTFRDGVLVEVEWNGGWDRLYEFLCEQRNLERFRATVDSAGSGVPFLRDNPELRVVEIQCDAGDKHVTQSLAKLNRLERLSLNIRNYHGDGLAKLVGLPNLTELDLRRTSIGDDDLSELLQLTQLRTLHLDQAKVTDSGVAKLRALPKLEVLTLDGTAVTDRALVAAADFPMLRKLYVQGTSITDAGVSALKAKRPDLEIKY